MTHWASSSWGSLPSLSPEPSDSSSPTPSDAGSEVPEQPVSPEPVEVAPPVDVTPEPTTETLVTVVQIDQGQMDMLLAGVLVTVFLLAAILFAQLRRP